MQNDSPAPVDDDAARNELDKLRAAVIDADALYLTGTPGVGATALADAREALAAALLDYDARHDAVT